MHRSRPGTGCRPRKRDLTATLSDFLPSPSCGDDGVGAGLDVFLSRRPPEDLEPHGWPALVLRDHRLPGPSILGPDEADCRGVMSSRACLARYVSLSDQLKWSLRIHQLDSDGGWSENGGLESDRRGTAN